MTKIAIVYGTSGGNTKLVCQQVAVGLEKAGHTIDMHRVIETSEHVFDDYSADSVSLCDVATTVN